MNSNNPMIIKKSLGIMAKKNMDAFFLKFNDNLENFNGNISRFNSFREIIEDLFNSNRD